MRCATLQSPLEPLKKKNASSNGVVKITQSSKDIHVVATVSKVHQLPKSDRTLFRALTCSNAIKETKHTYGSSSLEVVQVRNLEKRYTKGVRQFFTSHQLYGQLQNMTRRSDSIQQMLCVTGHATYNRDLNHLQQHSSGMQGNTRQISPRSHHHQDIPQGHKYHLLHFQRPMFLANDRATFFVKQNKQKWM